MVAQSVERVPAASAVSPFNKQLKQVFVLFGYCYSNYQSNVDLFITIGPININIFYYINWLVKGIASHMVAGSNPAQVTPGIFFYIIYYPTLGRLVGKKYTTAVGFEPTRTESIRFRI